MSKRLYTILLGILFVGFLLSRIATLFAAGSLWFDEAFSVHLASLPFAQMISLLAFEHNPWFHFLALRCVMFFTSSDALVRLPSLLAGVISFVLLAIVARKLWQSHIAELATCFLFSASTLLLYHQTEARMYSFVVLLTIAGLLSAWQWLETPRKSWLFCYLASTFLLVHTHLTAWFPLAILAGLVALEAKHQGQKIRAFLIGNAVVFLTGLVWFLPVISHRLGLGGASQGWFFAQNSDGYFFTHLTNFLVNGEPRLAVRALSAALLTLLMAAACIHIDRPHWWQKIAHVFDPKHWDLSLRLEWSRPVRLLTLWFALIMLAGFALQITVTKYLIAAVVPMLLLAGYGLSRLPKRLAVGVAAAILLLVAPMHFHLLQKRHHWDEAAKQISNLQSEYGNQVTIVHGFAGALPLRRYLPDTVNVTPFYPKNDSLSFDEAVTHYNWLPIVTTENIVRLDSLTANHNTVILVSTTVGSGEADPVKARLWQQGWKLLKRYEYSGYGDPEILVFGR